VAHSERFGGVWLPTRHADVATIAHDTEHFSSEGVIVAPWKPENLAPVGYAPPITPDPPFHATARRILERGDQAEDAFLAGVLHDVGRLVLVSRRPALMAEALATARRNGTSLHEGEIAALGVSHAEVGAYLLGIWGMPLEIVDAVLLHHGTPRTDRQPTSIARTVYLADRLAHDPDASVESLRLAAVAKELAQSRND